MNCLEIFNILSEKLTSSIKDYCMRDKKSFLANANLICYCYLVVFKGDLSTLQNGGK